MAKVKLSKEEKAERKARQQQIRQLWQSAGRYSRRRKPGTRDIYSNSSKQSKTLNMFCSEELAVSKLKPNWIPIWDIRRMGNALKNQKITVMEVITNL